MDGEFTLDNSALIESVARDRATIAEAKAFHATPNLPRGRSITPTLGTRPQSRHKNATSTICWFAPA